MSAACHGPLRAGGDKPDALKAQVVEVPDLQHVARRVLGVGDRSARDRLELRRADILDLGFGLFPIDLRGPRNGRQQHRIFRFARAGHRSKNVRLRMVGRNSLEVVRQARRRIGPRPFERLRAEPAAGGEQVVRASARVNEQIVLCIGDDCQPCTGDLRRRGLPLYHDQLGWLVGDDHLRRRGRRDGVRVHLSDAGRNLRCSNEGASAGLDAVSHDLSSRR